MRKAIWMWLSVLVLGWNCSAAALADVREPKWLIRNSIGITMVLIPAGEFMMGSRESPEQAAAAFEKYIKPPAEWFEDEHPRHRVRITRPFYLGACEVTVGQFRQFVKATGYRTDAEKATGYKGALAFNPDTSNFVLNEKYSWQRVGLEQTDEHPVVNISWNDAVAFCDWLSRKEGKPYRLPTEAEWEYACRAGTTTRYWHGDDPEGLARVANVADGTAKSKFPDWDGTISARDGYVFTAPVGSFRANRFGLYDMHGNVWEWCADWYDSDLYAASPADDPKGSDSGAYRVLRGGSWGYSPHNSRSAMRFRYPQDYRDNCGGFRVVRTP